MISRRTFNTSIAAWASSLTLPSAVRADGRLPAHPRLYLSTEELPKLRRNFADAAMTLEAQNIRNARRPMTLAMLSMLQPSQTDSEPSTTSARLAITLSLASLSTIDEKHNFQFEWLKELHQAACVYDWCYGSLLPEEKVQFYEHFVRLANGKDGGGFPLPEHPQTLVSHEAQGSVLGNHLAIGIALYDEHPEILERTLNLLRRDYAAVADFMFPGVADLSGIYYARHVHFLLAELMLKAVGLGPLFNSSLAQMPYEWIHALRPDGRMLRSGDNLDDESRARKLRFVFTLAGALYNDVSLIAMGEADLKEVPANQPFKAKYRQFDRLSAEELVIKFIAVSPRQKTEAHAAQWPFKRQTILHAPEPANRILFRTGWTLGTNESRDAVVDMRIGQYFIGNHQRKDFGSFQIYFRGPLAIPAGVYQGSKNSWYAQDHWINFYNQTISCNGILIRDPEEKPFLAGPHANDGGQIWPNNGNNHPANLSTLLAKKNGYRMAEVTAVDLASDGSFALIAGDLTAAYATSKVKYVHRTMLSIRTDNEQMPLIFVVRDEIVPTNPNFERSFLLHGTDQPIIRGNTVTLRNTRSTLTNDRGIFSGQYGGQLVLTALLPQTPKIRVIKGHRIGDLNFDAQKPAANGEESWGRVELSDVGSASTRFFNVMTVTDIGDQIPEMHRIEGENIVGFELEKIAVVFVDPEKIKNVTAQFELRNNNSRLLLYTNKHADLQVTSPSGERSSFDRKSAKAVLQIKSAAAGRYKVR